MKSKKKERVRIMEQKIIFREMLSEIKALADTKGNQLTVQEINDFFANAHLGQEQLEMVYEYLKSQRINVIGYEKRNEQASALFEETKDEPEEGQETVGVDRWEGMQFYLDELERIKKIEPREEFTLFRKAAEGDCGARKQLTELYLPMVCELAGDYEGDELLVEHLIQEGNMGLLLTLERLETADSLAAFQAQLLNGVNQYMQEVLKEQKDIREMGRGIAKRVDHLSQAIHNLEEELEHRVSVEELSAYLEMPAEEIRDILKMAGDELKVDGYENQ